MLRVVAPKHFVSVESVLGRRTVRMKVYPFTEYEEIATDAAKHLFRLLQRYNWSLEDPLRYRDRWAAFWPSISVVERKALALLIMSNSGTFGVRVELKQLPAILEPFKGQYEPVRLHSHVETELKLLVGSFYRTLTNRDELAVFLSSDCESEYEAITPFGGVSLAFDNDLILPEDFYGRCMSVLRSAGMADESAKRMALRLLCSLEEYLIIKEMKVWD